MTACIHCDGAGKWGAADRWVGGTLHGGWADSWYPCTHCEGTGEAPEPVCSTCKGTGTISGNHSDWNCPDCEAEETRKFWEEKRARDSSSTSLP